MSVSIWNIPNTQLRINLEASNSKIDDPSKIQTDYEINETEIEAAFFPHTGDKKELIDSPLMPIVKRTLYCSSIQGVPSTKFIYHQFTDKKNDFLKSADKTTNSFFSQRYCHIMSNKSDSSFVIHDSDPTFSFSFSSTDFDEFSKMLDFSLRYPRNIEELKGLEKSVDLVSQSYVDQYPYLLKVKKFAPNFLCVIEDKASRSPIKYPTYLDGTQSDAMKKITSSERKFIGQGVSKQWKPGSGKIITSHEIKKVEGSFEILRKQNFGTRPIDFYENFTKVY